MRASGEGWEGRGVQVSFYYTLYFPENEQQRRWSIFLDTLAGLRLNDCIMCMFIIKHVRGAEIVLNFTLSMISLKIITYTLRICFILIKQKAKY